MRVLRLSNSDDFAGDIPVEARPWHIAGEVLAATVGEPVETIARNTWPDPSLPDLVGQWLEKYEPDLVFLKVTWFWYAYESVPLRLKRRLGIVGRPLAAAGDRATQISWLAKTRAFKISRRALHRIIGGDAHFSEDQVIERMKAVIRKAVAREHVVLVVKGTGMGRDDTGTLAGYYDRYRARVERVEGEIEAFCQLLGVHYMSAQRKSRVDQDLHRGDGVHKGAHGLTLVGRREGENMALAWNAAHSDQPSAAPV